MTHKQWFNNVLHLHPVHEEGAVLFSKFDKLTAFDSCGCPQTRQESAVRFSSHAPLSSGPQSFSSQFFDACYHYKLRERNGLQAARSVP